MSEVEVEREAILVDIMSIAVECDCPGHGLAPCVHDDVAGELYFKVKEAMEARRAEGA